MSALELDNDDDDLWPEHVAYLRIKAYDKFPMYVGFLADSMSFASTAGRLYNRWAQERHTDSLKRIVRRPSCVRLLKHCVEAKLSHPERPRVVLMKTMAFTAAAVSELIRRGEDIGQTLEETTN